MRYLISILFLIGFLSANAEEFVVFEKDGYFGIKDQSGEVTVPAVYENLGWSDGSTSVVNGLIGYKRDNLWGLISARNKPITDQKFYTIVPVSSGFFKASIKGRFSNYLFHGILDDKGNTIISFNHFTIEPLGANWLVSDFKGSRQAYGVVSFENRVIISIKYKKIREENGLIIAQHPGEKMDLFQSQGRELQLGIDSLSYSNGWIIHRDGYTGFLSEKGKIIHDFQFKTIDIRGDQIETIPFPKWTLYDQEVEVLNFRCDSISVLDDRLLIAHLNGAQQLLLSETEINNREWILRDLVGEQLIAQNSKSRKWSVLSPEGTGIIKGFDSIYHQNSLYAALNREGWWLMDESGKRMNRLPFESLLAGVESQFIAKKNEYWGIFNSVLDKRQFKYDSIISASNVYFVNYLNRWGIMDANESWIVRPEFHEVKSLGEFLIGRKGKGYTIIKPREFRIQTASIPIDYWNGNLLIKDESGFGLVNNSGDYIVYPSYQDIQPLNNFYVLTQNGQLSIIDTFGKIVIDSSEHIEQVTAYNEDYFVVKKEGRWGFVDSQGRLRISNRYDEARPFYESMAAIKLRNKWGFIDKNEKLVVQPYYEEVSPFESGRSVVKSNDLYGIIDTNGNEVLALEWQKVERLETGNYLVQDLDGKIGLVNQSGGFILRPAYGDLKDYDDRVIVSRNNSWGVLNYSGEQIFKIIYQDLKIVDNFTMIKQQ